MKQVLGVTFALFFLIGCGGGGGGGGVAPQVSINPENVESLVVGETQLFEANATPAEETSFTWSASGGEIVPQANAAQAQYTAPGTSGDYTLSVETGAGAKDEISFSVLEADEGLAANSDPNVALETAVSLAPGSEQEYIIQIPESLSERLIYIELESDDDLTLEAGGYFSSGPTLFSDKDPAEGPAEGEAAGLGKTGLGKPSVTTQGIGDLRACRGPCIILNNTDAEYPITITNTGADAARFSLYAYEAAFSDTGEPANDEEECGVDLGDLGLLAVPVTPDAADGALETIGDVDCFEDDSTERVSISLSAPEGLAVPIIAEIYDKDQPGDEPFPLTLMPGETFASDCGVREGLAVIIAVRADELVAGAGVAGPSATTNYTLELSDTIAPECVEGEE